MKKIAIAFLLTGALLSGFLPGATGESPLPPAYDLRDVEGKCYVTPVKSQNVSGEWWNTVGLCWAFSSLACFESSLLKEGIVTDPHADLANLSPWHLGCFVGYNHPNYGFNHTALGNPPVPVSYALDSTLTYGWGGSALLTVDFLGRGNGLVLESDAPLPLEQMKNRETLSPPAWDLPMHYMLREGLLLDRSQVVSEAAYREEIKHALMAYGAVATPMYLGAPDFPGQLGQSYWRDDGYGEFYCDSPGLVDNLIHLVAVIGWDDHKRIAGAPEAGAWLIKDSLGADFHDGGYFWIAYDDTVFLKGASYAVALVADSGAGYSPKRYQTCDGGLSRPVDSNSLYEGDGFNDAGLDTWGLARFTAEGDGSLKAVGLVTLNKDEHVTVSIYQRWDQGRQRPAGLLLSEEIVIAHKGYHVIGLSEQIGLRDGEEFIISLGFEAKPGATGPLAYVLDQGTPPGKGKTYRASGASGEAGAWTDYTDIEPNAVWYVQGILAD